MPCFCSNCCEKSSLSRKNTLKWPTNTSMVSGTLCRTVCNNFSAMGGRISRDFCEMRKVVASRRLPLPFRNVLEWLPKLNIFVAFFLLLVGVLDQVPLLDLKCRSFFILHA